MRQKESYDLFIVELAHFRACDVYHHWPVSGGRKQGRVNSSEDTSLIRREIKHMKKRSRTKVCGRYSRKDASVMLKAENSGSALQ